MIKLLTLRNGFLEKEISKLGIKPIGYNFKKIKYTGRELTNFIVKFREVKPDIFLFWKDPQLTRKILIRLKDNSPKTKFVMWYGDQRGYCIPPLIKPRVGILDALLLTNKDKKQYKIYKKAGIPEVYTFYHSFSPTEFMLRPTPITHQVFFGGNSFKLRKFPLSKLRYKLVNILQQRFKLLVHGNGWPFPTEKIVLRPTFAKVLRRANINIGINHYDIIRYYNRRLFECVASGRLHITYYVPGMEADFKNHEHLVWFKSINEGLDIIRYYLKNPREREKVAHQGRKFFLAHHAWDHRSKQFAAIVKKILK